MSSSSRTDATQADASASRLSVLFESRRRFDEGMIEVKKSLENARQMSPYELFITIVTFPIWYTKSLYETTQALGPLPQNFDFSYAMMSYSYRTTNLVCYTLGVRIASFGTVEGLFETLFSPLPLFLIAFVLMPIYAVFLHKKSSLEKLSIIDRRALMALQSLLSGLFASHLLRHFISPSSSPPVYFVPAVISAVIYLFGEKLSSNRWVFMWATVGSATILSIFISATIAGPLTLNALISILIQTICAFVYVQGMIHDVITGETDLVQSNIVGLAMTMWTSLAYKVIFCPYNPEVIDENLPSLTSVFAS